ncbi:MAG: response regulator [Phormidium sp.]
MAQRDTGTNFFQSIHSEDWDRFISIIKALSPENSTYKTTYRLVRPDRQIIILEESGTGLFDEQGQLIRLIGITADITERQRWETQVILEQEGAIVQAVSLAAQAWGLLTLSRFDLLISDIGMPEMNGYVLIRKVRTLPPESNRDIPAIALTAYTGETNQHQALTSGFQVHLAKPIDPQQLLDAIRAALT